MAIDEVNERTSMTVTVSWFDEDDVAVTPQSATYRIDDVTSASAIVAKKAITGLSTTNDIAITMDQNSILGSSHPFETRRVTVEFTYDNTKHGTGEYLYRIKNLYGVTASASASASVSASASAS